MAFHRLIVDSARNSAELLIDVRIQTGPSIATVTPNRVDAGISDNGNDDWDFGTFFDFDFDIRCRLT